MKLREDWSLAYLLYYLCQIGYWLIIINLGMEIFTSIAGLSHDRVILNDIPVHIELSQFEEYNDIESDNIRLNISDRMESEVQVSGPFDEVKGAFFFFSGLKLYMNAVFFIILFMLSKMLKNVAEGEPFHSKNPSYLYVIGWTLIISTILNGFFQFLNIGHFISLPLFSDLALPDGIDIPSLNLFGENFLMAGIFIIVLGYVFKEGTRIYQEQKLTV